MVRVRLLADPIGDGAMPLTGRCRCKTTSYALDYATEPLAYACHCLECQAMSGGACVVQLPIVEHRLSVFGDLVVWENLDAQGNTTTQRFCSTCKTRLFSTNTGRPGMALLRGGTLDRSDALAPVMHIWTKRKQPWIVIPSDVMVFLEAAPADVSRTTFAQNFSTPV